MVRITSNKFSATFTTLGAQMTSLRANADQHEYLWQGNPDFWGRQAPVLFPFVGRLKDDQYEFEGKMYHQTQHGFARDMEFQLVQQNDNRVTFILESNEDTKQNYPFDFELQITYAIDDQGLTVEYVVTNLGKTEMLYSIGAHPGFNVPFVDGEAFEQTKVAVNPNFVYRQIPLIGPYHDMSKERALDMTKSLSVDRKTFKNDAIIFDLQGAPVDVSLISKNGDHGITVRLSDTPYVGVWSPYPKNAPFMCIEPWWGIADSVDSDQQLTHKTGIRRLAAQTDKSMGYKIMPF